MNNLTLEITSAVARSDGGERVLHGFAEACRMYGFSPAVQLHNTVSDLELRRVISCNLPMSAHVPVVGDLSLNLATEKNLDIIWRAFDENAEFMRKHNIKKSVFHGFSMCDEIIPRMRSQKDYRETLRKSCRDEFLLQDTWLNVDYTYLDENGEKIDVNTKYKGAGSYADLGFINDYFGKELTDSRSTRIETDVFGNDYLLCTNNGSAGGNGTPISAWKCPAPARQ